MKKMAIGLVCSILWFTSLGAGAIEINVDPTSQNVALGDSVSIDVNISGLGEFAPDSLGVYDIDVSFDAALLNLAGVTFGDQLDLFGLGSFQLVTGIGPVNVFELSFDSPTDLDTLQQGAFRLFTMNFDTIAVGSSNIMLSINEIGDSFGLPLSATVVNGGVAIESSGAVPEPATVMLIGFGLAGIRYRRWKKRL